VAGRVGRQFGTAVTARACERTKPPVSRQDLPPAAGPRCGSSGISDWRSAKVRACPPRQHREVGLGPGRACPGRRGPGGRGLGTWRPGRSAAVVGAQITSGLPLGELYRAQLEATDQRPVATDRRVRWLMAWAMLGSRDPARFRQRTGMAARSANTMSVAQRRARFQRRLPVHLWPDRPLLLTAVDALSGQLVVFDRGAAVALQDAVAASCAAPRRRPGERPEAQRHRRAGVSAHVEARELWPCL